LRKGQERIKGRRGVKKRGREWEGRGRGGREEGRERERERRKWDGLEERSSSSSSRALLELLNELRR